MHFEKNMLFNIKKEAQRETQRSCSIVWICS